MKIRNGFVSNSSSSSFIVIWDKKPESVEEVKKILFGDAEFHHSYGDPIATEILARTIFEDTSDTTLDQIKDEQRQVFDFSTYNGWGEEPHWESVGYKGNEELMDKYAEDMIKLTTIEEDCRKILDNYTREERNRILRKFKLERILEDGEEITESERLFIDTENKYQETRNLKWKHSLFDDIINESTKLLIEDHKDKFIAVYEYGDDNTIGSCIEHQGCFDNLTNWRISHH